MGARERHKPNLFPNTRLGGISQSLVPLGLPSLSLDTSTPHLVRPHTILRVFWSRYGVLKESTLTSAMTNNHAMLRGG